MSVSVFFSFSTGLRETIKVPNGTIASIRQHVNDVESALLLKSERYKDNPAHWTSDSKRFEDIDDDALCQTVMAHNNWVRRLYGDIADWSQSPVQYGEDLTPEIAATFWHALEILDVPVHRWTGEYYRNRMEHLYQVMRGHTDEGVTFDARKLTPQQAGAVVGLFETFLDPQDLRLEVPKGCDYLASSYYGEYDWCQRCGAVLPEYAENCRKRSCPVQANWCDEDRPLWFREEGETDKAFTERCRARITAQGWRKATREETPCRFINDECGSVSNAKNWVDLWMTEGEGR